MKPSLGGRGSAARPGAGEAPPREAGCGARGSAGSLPAPMSTPVSEGGERPGRACFLASDVHLGVVPPETEEAFLAWLDHVGREGSHLVLAGDVFDFWFEYGRTIPKGPFRVLARLARLVESGVRVDLIGGNHDWWGGSFLEEEVGVRFHRRPVSMELAGRRALVAHGDGLGAGDRSYRALRRLLRGSLARRLFAWLHPDVGIRLAEAVSRTEATLAGPTAADRRRAEVLEAWARRRLESDPSLDVVALGHAHIPRLVEVEGGRHYVNAGDWTFHRSFAVLAPGSPPRIGRWPGGG